MKILVTGGAGFIGSNLVDALIDAGHEVVVVDNLVTGQRRNINERARFYELDLRGPEIEAVLAAELPDLIDHHAAHADVRESVDDPVYNAEVNVLGTVRLLHLAVKYGVRKLIFISTGGAIYGEPQVLPCTEDHPATPLSPYGTSKLAGELYLETYRQTFGLDYTVLRYANVYGPRQDTDAEEGRVIAIFTQLMLAGRTPRINGTGQQQRDFVYVGDCVDANVRALTGGSGQVFNIGTGKPTSILQLADTLRELTGYSGQLDFGPERAGEVQNIFLDWSRAKEQLGWQPRMALEQGLRETVEYFRDRVSAQR
jgi:UDP-glucose 4-epimerase